MGRVQSGLEILVTDKWRSLRGARVGLICHQASIDSRLRHAADLFMSRGIELTALFAPEHGFWGTAQDQIEIPDMKTVTPAGFRQSGNKTIPIYSLYGESRSPSAESLQNMDILICDLQDVGSRYYTFIWTMALAMEVCSRTRRKIVVLDRPNPLGGKIMEGPVLDPEFSSFVGLYPIPVRHGMTIGEIALWVKDFKVSGVDLEVIRMRGWKRSMYFDETGLPWVLPSPNMPALDTAVVYPGACLIEGTNVSEGRGTTRPFELIGAPYIKPEPLCESLNHAGLPGVIFRPCRFEPTFHKFQGRSCGGLQIHVTDRRRFKPFLTGLAVIQKIYDLFPDEFAWRQPPYEYEKKKLPIDILCGTDVIRKAIEASRPIAKCERAWLEGLVQFAQQRRKYLLYN